MKTNSSNVISLRSIKEGDCRIIWEWANDAVSREASFSSESISWKDHIKWFERKLKDPNCLFYVITLNSTLIPVGVVRYDANKNSAVISINIAPNQRRKHIGPQAITLSTELVFRSTSIQIIHAYIKTDNINSINAFKKAGYTNAGFTQFNNNSAYDYTRIKKSFNDKSLSSL